MKVSSSICWPTAPTSPEGRRSRAALPAGEAGCTQRHPKATRALYDVACQGPGALRRPPKVRFASDSLLEGDGFELPVPREKKSRNSGIPSEFN